ncbi:unnamed protein product [Boreogadus saida]
MVAENSTLLEPSVFSARPSGAPSIPHNKLISRGLRPADLSYDISLQEQTHKFSQGLFFLSGQCFAIMSPNNIEL